MADLMTEHPDRFLAARMVRGDEAAFWGVFRIALSGVVSVAMPRVGNDAAVTEEVVQAALARRWVLIDATRVMRAAESCCCENPARG
jgi:hypothetical protein